VRDYESYKVVTVEGRVLAGLVVSESADMIEIQQASGEKLRLDRDDIELIAPSTVSIMPAGLEEALTETELLDVVTYLQSLS
jgi:putative heme-binding domain-containing protein